jgi:hypothetical protein
MKLTKLGMLVLTFVAALALASTALAKGGTGGGGTGGGGGGGGGASCVQIADFTVTPAAADGQTTLTTSYTVDNSCVDHENMSVAAIDYSNSTGVVGRAVWMLPYGPTTYTSNAAPVTPGVYTETLTVYTPGGKVGDTRTLTVTIPS